MIRPPPYLLALGVSLWGLASGRLALAAVAALLLEAPRLLPQRFDLTRRDFERGADLSTLAVVLAAALLFAQSRNLSTAMLHVLSWLPMLFLGLVLAQRFSVAGRMPASALFWSLRRQRRPVPERWLNVDYSYFGVCLIAASAANVRAHWYFAALIALSLYALQSVAPRGRRGVRWAAAAGVAAVIGFGIQAGLSTAQAAVQELVFDWLDRHWRAQADPYRTHTAIGDIGALKGSDRILMRVASEGKPPQLLRSATYPHYGVGIWSAAAQALPFRPLTSTGQDWVITEGSGPKVHLSTWLDDESALLALPLGAYRLEGLNVARVERNALGTIRVEQGPESLNFTARVDAEARSDAAPDSADLRVGPALEPVLEEVSREIGLARGDRADAPGAIEDFFRSHFAYTLDLDDGHGTGRSLRQFLLEDRRGHCEYFATATVLLLRHAGIPARYATGFSVQEFSELEQQYVVRARHAHAWALAWIDGRWQALDTTPADWAQQEAAGASPLQPVYDLASWLYYRFAVWSAEGGGTDGAPASLLWFVPPLVFYLGWRLYRRRHVPAPAGKAGRGRSRTDQPNPDVQAVLDRLAARGLVRPAQRALLEWVEELPLTDPHARELLIALTRDYYRIRFDPLPAPAAVHAALGVQTRRLLALLS
jgi:protein-glutamine gamma-glutamyltransferase